MGADVLVTAKGGRPDGNRAANGSESIYFSIQYKR